MHNQWILDVLNDLRNFAASNELPELHSVLEKAEVIASKELSMQASQQVSLVHACFSEEAEVVGPAWRNS